MKPSEIYNNWPPIFTEKGPYILWKHISHHFHSYEVDIEEAERVEVRQYVNSSSDGYRGMNFYSVWFDDQPVMLVQEAGRSNSDHKEVFITNGELYREMIEYIRSLGHEEDMDYDTYPEDDDIPDKDLLHFYGEDVRDFYKPETCEPKYKVGDIVMAEVPENHLNYEKDRVVARVKIQKVYPYDPHTTYHGTQLDRHWSKGVELRKQVMTFTPNGGGIGASFNDNLIRGLWEGPEIPEPVAAEI